MNTPAVIDATRRWVEDVVIGLNLCPFARKELLGERVSFVVTDAASPEGLLLSLQQELNRLERDPQTETTLLIHPEALTDFDDYNDFLDLAEGFLAVLGYEGVYQIASFHPHYRFEGTGADDAENYTNRSPFPMLHLLREESMEKAIAGYPDTHLIPEKNIQRVTSLGVEHMQLLLAGCFTARPATQPR